LEESLVVVTPPEKNNGWEPENASMGEAKNIYQASIFGLHVGVSIKYGYPQIIH